MSSIPTRSQAPMIVRAGAVPGRGPAAPAAGIGLTGKDVVRILRRRILLIILSVVITVVVAVLVTLVWGFYSPLYTADALLTVNRPRSQSLGLEPLPPGEVMDRLVTSAAQEVASSRSVLVAATNDNDVRRTRWFEKDKDRAIIRLQEEVSISPVPKTNYVRVSMTGRDGSEMATIVNAVARSAVKEKNTSTTKNVVDDITALEAELSGLETKVADARLKAASSKEGKDRPEPSKIAELQAVAASSAAKLQILAQQIASVEMDKQTVGALWDYIKTLKPEDLARMPQVVIPVENDPILQGLRNQRIGLDNRRETIEREQGPKHPEAARLRATVNNLDQQIQQRRLELLQRQTEMYRMETQRAPEMIAQKVMTLRVEVSRLETEQKDAVKELEGTKANYEADRQNLERQRVQADREVMALMERKTRIERRLDELRLEKSRLEVFEIGRAAFPPDIVSWPKWKVMIPLGVVLGLIIGLGLAFLLELVDTSIKSPTDVSRRVDLPLLGMVPHADDLEDEIEDMRLAWMTHPHSIVSEAYRQIRTTLLFSGPADQRRSLLITSPLPGDGRTSVALNLAGCIARSGHRVLLIDANFRQPTVSTLFPQAPQAGFSSALVGQVDWRQQVHEVEENLFILGAGPKPPNPAELLGSQQLRTFIQEMQTEYDQVIFDGPPCLVVTDSPVLSTQVDGVILVVRAGANTYGIVQRTRDILERVGAHTLGVILNGVRVTAGGYLKKNYETYYEYHQPPQLTADEKAPSDQGAPVA